MSEPLPSDALRCSFCGKDQDEVLKLIAGPTVYICNECIELCNDIVAEEVAEDAGDPPPKPRGLEHVAACVVCRKPKLLEDMMGTCSSGPVCRACASDIRREAALAIDIFAAEHVSICSLCGEERSEQEFLAIADRGEMCGTCVEAVLNAARAQHT